MDNGLQELNDTFFRGEARPLPDEEEFQARTVAGTAFHFRTAPPALRTMSSFKALVLAVREGALTATIAPTTYTVEAGDIFLALNFLDFELSAKSEVKFDVFTCPAWWASRELFSAGGYTANIKISADFFSASVIRHLILKMSSGVVPRDLMHEAAAMLAGMVRQSLAISRAGDPTPVLGRIAIGRFQRILDYISRNLGDYDVSPQDAAKYLKCSLRTIHQTCAQNSTTFNHLLIEFRLMSAAYALRYTRRRVSEVAYECGFRSLSHFCRLFKERYGVVASAFRHQPAAGDLPAHLAPPHRQS